MNDIDDSILKAFLQEAQERLQNLNSCLLELEKNPQSQETIEEIFREAHTLKGSARMVGLEDIGTISHKLEDIFGSIKKSEIELSEDLLNLIFFALDSVQLLIEEANSGNKQGVETENICDKLHNFLCKPKNEANKNPQEKKAEAVEKAAEVIVPEERIKEKEPKPKTFQRSKKEDHAFRKIDDTVRVSSSQLDNLVNLVGELVISESSGDHQERLLKETLSLSRRTRSLFSKETDFNENTHREKLDITFLELNRILHLAFSEFKKEKDVRDIVIQKLQDQVLDLRLLPVSVVFDAFPRMIRDLASSAKKEVKLSMDGMDTKLDKKVLEQIKDPLIHIIRNSIDHGLENPETRKQLSKKQVGELKLSAYQEGESVVIEVFDDGSGIDVDRVREKALEQELVSKKDAAVLNVEDWLTYIFEPGFSTKKEVDALSGRGVGLDVAKKNIEDLKGNIKVQTELGKFTKFIMKLPLTLAVSRALLIEVAGQKFAIPSTTVSETNIIYPESIQTIEGKETFRLREKSVGIIDVGKTLGLSKNIDNGHKRQLVCLAGYELVALAVDKFYGESEIIVKNAGVHLNNLQSIAGVTIIEGELVPILRASYIVKRYQNTLGISSLSKPAMINSKAEQSSDGKNILIVEDSLTTREMEKHMLESAGFTVDEAVDGIEALEKISRNSYALLIVDIQMPRMNGLDLIKNIRKEKIFESLSIIIVSSLGSDEDKAKGLEVGADYYISKNDLLQKDFIGTVKEFIE